MYFFLILPVLAFLASGDGEMFGAPRKLQSNEATLEKFSSELAKATHQFNREHGNHTFHIVTELINATSQVVAGIIYKLFVKFTPASCTDFAEDKVSLDNIVFSRDSCDSGNNKSKICKVTIWKRPWLASNESEIIKIVNCSVDAS
ncbi:Proteinase inhibitor I25 [Schistosoma japonicum]|uniref:SJCHGC06844 protein n=1 Tax=Schistosoma japonicum TaxID=6182 RepID=Q5DB58_SCHJA|nr:SJCHGC06844 protein [Schistosoma japonicum]ABL86193.1 unknown [Schistosoma japonicum]KAH8861848.1 Proteinase inhibitor I25 [Schistosoma japonicum]KAH8861849.1 Proteinase inhibitor I25 [Schistosoma japonicum]